MSAAAASAGRPRQVLLPYQARWVRDPAQVKVIEKSRRIGISWACAYAAVMHAGEGGGNVYYQSYSQDNARTFIQDCGDWAEDIQLAISDAEETLLDLEDGKGVQALRVRLGSGKEILAMTSAPRAFRSKGRPGDLGIVDEAAFVDDLGEVLKAALAFTLWGGRIWVVSTHNGAESPFAELCEDIRKGRLGYSLHTVDLDAAIADGLARRIHEVTGRPWQGEASARAWRAGIIAKYGRSEQDEAAQEELFCVPRRSGAIYFSRTLVESRMADAPIARFAASAGFEALPEAERRRRVAAWLDAELYPVLNGLDPQRRHVYGQDFARTGHLSVIAAVAVDAHLRRRCVLLVELSGVAHQQQVQICQYIAERLPRFGGAAHDATGNGEYVAEAMGDRFGRMIIQQKFNEAWYGEWMPKYKAALEDGLMQIPRSADVLDDHRLVKVVNGVPKLPPAGPRARRHGDSVVALALAWQAAASDLGEVQAHIQGRQDGDGGRWLTGLDDSLAGHGGLGDSLRGHQGLMGRHRGGFL